MPAKVIQISDDGGSNYFTLPGNTGEFSDEGGVLEDTIFGQNFKSGQSSLINWGVKANALYKGFAGYQVDLKKPGTSTTMTAEAMTLVSGKTYKITNAAKNIWDRTGTFTVYDNAVNRNSQLLNVDYLYGQVTFLASYTVVGPVTVDGKYFPAVILAKYRNFTLNQTMEAIDNTDIPTAQGNSGHRTFSYGIKSVSLELGGVYAAANGYRTDLVNRTELIIEINPDGGGKSIARGFFLTTGRGQKGSVGELEEETVSLTLQVPTPTLGPLKTPFRWEFTASDLSTSVQKMLQAYENETTLKVKYLPDGSTGLSGDCVVTDISLSGGLDAMNEFSVGLQGTGVVATV